jgi:uncharacterized protein
MTPLGVGVVYVAELLPLLRDADDIVSVVEIEPQTLWRRRRTGSRHAVLDPSSIETLRSLPQQRLAHGIGMPIGGSVAPDAQDMELLCESLDELRPRWFSEHLSFNRSRDGATTPLTGFLLPPRQVRDVVDLAACNIDALARRTGLPLAFETGVNYFAPAADEMDDGEFFAAVAETADCGILVDLHNLWTNERNGRQPWQEVIASLPPERVWEIHVAGGNELEGFWLDSHAELVPEPVLAGLENLLNALPNVGAVVFEILPAHVARVGLDAIGRQLEVLRALWDRRTIKASKLAGSRRSARIERPSTAAVEAIQEWESALVARIAAPSLSDPAAALYHRLTGDFRSGAIAQCLRCTVTLLFLTLGVDRTERLMHEYLRHTKPQLFVDDEALQFAHFLSSSNAHIPFLDEVLGFESGLLRATQRGEEVAVTFEHDPDILFESLTQGRYPRSVSTRRTNIWVSPRGELRRDEIVF